jgi:hypothetical protein
MSVQMKGLLLGALHLAIVLSLGGKLLYDRATRPRVWVLAQTYDPDLPIRGRYLSERLSMPMSGFDFVLQDKNSYSEWYLNRHWAYYEVQSGKLVANSKGSGSAGWVAVQRRTDGSLFALTEEPVLLFVPDNADLSVIKPRSEIWVEVTVPRQGPPRPIRIAIKNESGFIPLDFK